MPASGMRQLAGKSRFVCFAARVRESPYTGGLARHRSPLVSAGIAGCVANRFDVHHRNNRHEPKRQKCLSRRYDWTDVRSVSFCCVVASADSGEYGSWLKLRDIDSSPGFWRMFLPEAVSVREFVIEPPGRFFSSTSAVRNGRYLTEENFHAKVR